jgi:hypothetical protein
VTERGLSAAYRGAGTWHEVQVTRDPNGRWQVIDSVGSQATLVETLTGHDDRLLQAQALARDYADQQRAYRAGERESNPLPRRPDSAPETAAITDQIGRQPRARPPQTPTSGVPSKAAARDAEVG